MRAKRYGHLDANHTEIASRLRGERFSVGETSAAGGFVDLVVSDGEMTSLVEVKVTTGAFRLSQLLFIAAWKGNVCFVTSPDDAVDKLRNREFLTPIQKEKILQFVYRKKVTNKTKDPRVSVKELEKIGV